MKLVKTLVAVLAVSALSAQTVELVKVQSKRLERMTRLPGEILPYQKVALHARVTGFVEKVAVDRGSPVKAGQALAVLANHPQYPAGELARHDYQRRDGRLSRS